jgi:hypothetical protein
VMIQTLQNAIVISNASTASSRPPPANANTVRFSLQRLCGY